MAKVTMPQLGESVAEGTIGKWLKKPGDHVAKYEPLLEVITDKVNAEVPSPYEGILKEILVEEGATVPNNAEIAVIEESAATTGAAAPSPAEPSPAEPSPAEPSPAEPSPAEPTTPAASEQPTVVASESVSPTPAAVAPPDQAREPESAPTPAPMSAAGATAAPAAGTPPMPSPMAEPAATAHGPAGSDERAPGEMPGDAEARMTPAVRRLLREHGLSAAMIVGSGGGGRITREDVTDYVESQRTGQPVGKQDASARADGANGAAGAASAAQPVARGSAAPASAASAPTAGASAPAAAAPAAAATAPRGPSPSAAMAVSFPDGADEVLVPLTQMRKGIAAQMTRALQAPHAYVTMEIDVTSLVRLREREKRDYQAREGLSLSYVPFVVKAAAEALKRHPTMNAHWTEQGLLVKRRVNVGVAVAVEDGLIVPVIRDVDQLSINGLNKAIADVSARARAGKFKIDDFGGGTFTVDNTGWLGSNLTMPILNVPEVAILTMEAITKRPVVVETPDGDVIAIRSIMNMVLAIDHRANDGAGGSALLRDIKAWLEAVGPDTAIY